MMRAKRKMAELGDELHADASRKTGLHDFGGTEYRVGLSVLLESLDADRELSDTGWQECYDWILTCLIARLHAQHGWNSHPEVLSAPIERPLIITGLPRSGTTALHRLLSVDPQFQGIEHWLLNRPMIRPPRETWESHPGYRECVAHLEAHYLRRPIARQAHEVVAAEVDECTSLLEQSFVSNIWSFTIPLPMYDNWLRARTADGPYRRYTDVLRLIGANEPHKRWLLKSPFHIVEMESLLNAMPDACIVHTHRDPLTTIPSLCSLVDAIWGDWEADRRRFKESAIKMCEYWATALERTRAVRLQRPHQFFQVEHQHFKADPLRVVRSIYDYFDIRLSTDAESRMRDWADASPTTRHGKHEYSFESWGVTPAQIREVFREYRTLQGY